MWLLGVPQAMHEITRFVREGCLDVRREVVPPVTCGPLAELGAGVLLSRLATGESSKAVSSEEGSPVILRESHIAVFQHPGPPGIAFRSDQILVADDQQFLSSGVDPRPQRIEQSVPTQPMDAVDQAICFVERSKVLAGSLHPPTAVRGM